MWNLFKVKDLGLVVTGTTPPSKKPEQFGDKHPFITPSDMDTSRKIATQRSISSIGAMAHNRKILPKDSVCFVCIGATIGKICMTSSDSMTNQQINSIIVNRSMHDPLFVYYLLSTYREKIRSIAGGAATPIVNKTSFEEVHVLAPPLKVQRCIASILSTYDDLIENNTRRIAILEEMARRIYTEWFVNFRFPGYEKVKMVDSELGRIPSGWELKTLRDLCFEKTKSIKPELFSPETPYIGLEHIPRRSITFNEWGQAGDIASSKKPFNKGDILFGKIRPYFHKVAIAPVNGISSTDAIVIEAVDRKWFPIVLSCVSSDAFVDHATQTSNGTKMPRANWKVLVKYRVVCPPNDLLERFNDIITNIVNQTQNLMFKNQNLRQTRDLLLPKLISGDIDVSKMEVAA